MYDAEPLLPQVEGTALREERLQLYVRLGQAERALSLIINEMKDLQRAEQFCAYWKPEYTRPDDDFKYDAHTKGRCLVLLRVSQPQMHSTNSALRRA